MCDQQLTVVSIPAASSPLQICIYFAVALVLQPALVGTPSQSQKACEGQQSGPSLGVGSPVPSAPLLLICLSWKILVFNWIYSTYHSLKASEI